MIRPILTPLLALPLLAACGEPTVYNAVEGPRVAAVSAATLAPQAVALVNDERGRAGLAPLSTDPFLQAAAQAEAGGRATTGNRIATSTSGMLGRARAQGYQGCALGEMTARVHITADAVIDAWMRSPDERGTLLSPRAQQIGLAATRDESGRVFWAVVTGTPC